VYAVNTTIDKPDLAIDGVCSTGDLCNGSPCCTLRAALMEANLGPNAGGDEVRINVPAGTYLLTIPIGDPDSHANGDLNVFDYVTVRIAGAGPDRTIIDANQLDRALFVGYSAAVTLTDLRIQGGRPPTGVTRNGGRNGGGIYNDRASLTLLRCLVRANAVTVGGYGGGIYSNLGSLNVVDSAVRINSSELHGGGICGEGTATTITRSTVNANSAVFAGGGILQEAGGNLRIANSTIGQNAASSGGGMYLGSAGTVALNNVTMATNTASGTSPAGADVYLYSSSLVLSNSILVNASNGGLACAAGATVTSNGFNIVDDATNCSITGSYLHADPILGALGGYGGPTATFSLAVGSPAIDAGYDGLFGCADADGNPLVTDQRGVQRPLGGRCDLGAFEIEPIGDANGDGTVDVSDIFYLVNFLFAGGPIPLGRANVNGGNGAIDVSDVFYLINYLFAGGQPPVS
jgi:hypothetical protein